jgi:uncharacterized protein (DUF2384 family)
MHPIAVRIGSRRGASRSLSPEAHQRPAACATTLDRRALDVIQVEVETLRLTSKPACDIETGGRFLRCSRGR